MILTKVKAVDLLNRSFPLLLKNEQTIYPVTRAHFVGDKVALTTVNYLGEEYVATLVKAEKYVQVYAEHNSEALLEQIGKLYGRNVSLKKGHATLTARVQELEALTAEQDKRLVSYAAIATKNASQARTVSVKLPEPFTKSMYGTALYEHDDIFAMLADAGIKLEVGE